MATTPTSGSETKKQGPNALAIVGFGALIVAGIFLAIFAARYVPETLSRLSSAVILSTDGEQNTEDATTTEEATPAEEETVTPTRPTTPVTGGPQVVTPTGPVVSPTTPIYYPSTPNLYGQADLSITNLEAGYFRGSTFVRDTEVPSGRDAAVRFTVKNTGTNSASGWRVSVDVTGEDTVRGTGGMLMPNGTQTFTLRIENPREGRNLDIDIEVDYQNDVRESNERNNDRSIDIDIERD